LSAIWSMSGGTGGVGRPLSADHHPDRDGVGEVGRGRPAFINRSRYAGAADHSHCVVTAGRERRANSTVAAGRATHDGYGLGLPGIDQWRPSGPSYSASEDADDSSGTRSRDNHRDPRVGNQSDAPVTSGAKDHLPG
jgi:hypothetical protein